MLNWKQIVLYYKNHLEFEGSKFSEFDYNKLNSILDNVLRSKFSDFKFIFDGKSYNLGNRGR